MPPEAIFSRPFCDDADFWSIRQLVINTYPLTGPGWNWDIRRWDGARFYSSDPALPADWARTIRLWETAAGELVGAANADGPGLFYLQIQPDYRELIEEEMIAWAEDAISAPGSNGAPGEVQTEVYDYDAPRQRILARRGYEKLNSGMVIRKMRLGKRPLAQTAVELAGGCRLRTIHGTDWADCQRLADLLNAAFQRSFHQAGEFFQFSRHAPSVREDLHLVAEAPDGSFAAHVGVIYDAVNQRGLFEPVCTHPAQRRKNLAQALMFEGLRRAAALGAREITVETGDMIPANALYDSLGFSEVYSGHGWRKSI